MNLKHLWAPWRKTYIQNFSQKKNAEGLFKSIADSTRDEENFVFLRGKTCFVFLNRYPYNLGHLLIAPYRAVPDINDLTDAESAELWQLTREMTVLLRKIFKPDGFNIGINIGAAAGAGIPDHIHIHIIPRWANDINFITTVGGARIHPGDLPAAYQVLKNAVQSA